MKEERKKERDREREIAMKREECLTLAGWDVAVSPVDPVFIICDVAPWLHIPIRVPAEARVSLHQQRQPGMFGQCCLTVYRGNIPARKHPARSGRLAKVSKEDYLDRVRHPEPRWHRLLLVLCFLGALQAQPSGCCCSLMRASLFRSRRRGSSFCL